MIILTDLINLTYKSDDKKTHKVRFSTYVNDKTNEKIYKVIPEDGSNQEVIVSKEEGNAWFKRLALMGKRNRYCIKTVIKSSKKFDVIIGYKKVMEHYELYVNNKCVGSCDCNELKEEIAALENKYAGYNIINKTYH